jgi:hypothetical protein
MSNPFSDNSKNALESIVLLKSKHGQMKIKGLYLLIIAVVASLRISGQDFKDLIVTNASDTIHCKITLVNNYNIFYTWNPKKKKIVDTYIARKDVAQFISADSSIEILEEETPPPPRPKSNFAEKDGLIYPAALITPPVFARGQNDLYYYLSENVRVYPRDRRTFGANSAISLFKIKIDETGKVFEADVYESAVQTGGFPYDCKYLENEIKSVLGSMTNWTPAKTDGANVATTVYVPLKYAVEGNAIRIYPSKYLFTFKDRE